MVGDFMIDKDICMEHINHITIYFGLEAKELVFMPKDIEMYVKNFGRDIHLSGVGCGDINTYDILDIIFSYGKEMEYDQHNFYSLDKIKEYKKSGMIDKISCITVTLFDMNELRLYPTDNKEYIETKDNEALHILYMK